MFVISKNSLYRGSLHRGCIPYILLQLWPGHRISFIISRTSLNRGYTVKLRTTTLGTLALLLGALKK